MRAETLVKVSDKALVLTGRSGVARDEGTVLTSGRLSSHSCVILLVFLLFAVHVVALTLTLVAAPSVHSPATIIHTAAMNYGPQSIVAYSGSVVVLAVTLVAD